MAVVSVGFTAAATNLKNSGSTTAIRALQSPTFLLLLLELF